MLFFPSQHSNTLIKAFYTSVGMCMLRHSAMPVRCSRTGYRRNKGLKEQSGRRINDVSGRTYSNLIVIADLSQTFSSRIGEIDVKPTD